MNLEKIQESIALLKGGRIPYEFRTTVVDPLHDAASIEAMGRWLHNLADGKPVKKLFLQPFVDRNTVVFSGLNAPESSQMEEFVELLRPYILEVSVKG